LQRNREHNNVHAAIKQIEDSDYRSNALLEEVCKRPVVDVTCDKEITIDKACGR
jgi:hypothetical protein